MQFTAFVGENMPEYEMTEQTFLTPVIMIIIVIALIVGIFILGWFGAGRGASTAIANMICGFLSLMPFGGSGMAALLRCPALVGV